MIDVGGGSVKLRVTGRRIERSFDSPDNMTPNGMVARVKSLTANWDFDVISIGYPGLIQDGHPIGDPPRVGSGWVGFDYEKALGRPVRMINDAAMQALAAYRGRRMLFLGLGTGLGSTLIANDVLVPLELGWLRFDSSHSLLQQLAEDSPKRLGRQCWRRDVITTVDNLGAAFNAHDIVLGGGNAARLFPVPKAWRLRTNSQAIHGALRLWGDGAGVIAEPRGQIWEIRGMKTRSTKSEKAP